MFILAKFVGLLVQPLVWVAVALLLALFWICRKPVAARAALVVGLALVALSGWQAVPDQLLRRLETTFPPPQESLDPFVGVVVLGGLVEPFQVWQMGDQTKLTVSSERLTVPARLMERNANLRLLYVGRERAFPGFDGAELPIPDVLFAGLGIDLSRVSFERMSRNTQENAILGAALPGIDKHKRWLLVTSARHMPRAMSEFVAQGWNVTPYPVDYLASSTASWTDYSLAKGPLHWQAALHESVGLLVSAITRGSLGAKQGRAPPIQ